MPRRRRKGFSLIEAAIVLGIVGIVIGGIWIAASAVNFNHKMTVLVADVTDAVRKIREMKWGSTGATANELFTMKIMPQTYTPLFGGGTWYREPNFSHSFGLAIISGVGIRVLLGGPNLGVINPKVCIHFAKDMFQAFKNSGWNGANTMQINNGVDPPVDYPLNSTLTQDQLAASCISTTTNITLMLPIQ